MSIINNSKEELKESKQYKNIKKFLKDNNLNPKKSKDLLYLLSLTLKPKIKEYKPNYLLNFLLELFNRENEKIFYEYFFLLCKLDKLHNIKLLLDKGLSINYQNDLGETPLHIAISKGNIELIKLLIKYEPSTNISTKKDGYTAMNYAEISGNPKIIQLIDDLNEKNKKKIIHSEIVDYINKDMNYLNSIDIKNISSFKNKNIFDEIQNYNGEIISIITNEEKNASINKNNNTIGNININNKKLLNKKIDNIYTITQKILNESDLSETFSPKNIIKVDNYKNGIDNINSKYHHKFLNENSIKISKNILKKNFTSPFYKKNNNLLYYTNNKAKANNLSCMHSLTTLHTLNKGLFQSSYTLKEKIMELYKFMFEINLPKIYAKNLLDNGFNDLKVLIMQTKNGIALSNQNLKDIGINLAGDRAKILIHLEELAENYPFLLEKDIIYSNKIEENNKNSLYKFFTSINLPEIIKTFYKKGYYNAELLFMQMVSKHPINEKILKNDFGINKIGLINQILLNLTSCSKKYIKRLKNKNIENLKYM